MCVSANIPEYGRSRCAELETQLAGLVRETVVQVGEMRMRAKQEAQRLTEQAEEALRDALELAERGDGFQRRARAMSEQLAELQATTVPRSELLDARADADRLRRSMEACCRLAQSRDEEVAVLCSAVQVTRRSVVVCCHVVGCILWRPFGIWKLDEAASASNLLIHFQLDHCS